jgi:pyruvate dehydrogenase E2 component (dihydrolipoamide acetyltransferase)
MTFNFKLPDIGEGVAEGEITRWLVKEGDLVKEDQPMVEVMTDKATVEITSPKSGRIQKILYPEGSVAPVHQVIVVIDEDAAAGADGGGSAAPAAPKAAAPAPKPAAREPAPRAPERPAANPPAPKAPAAPPPRRAQPPPPPLRAPAAAGAAKDPVEEVPTRPAAPEPARQAGPARPATPFARAGAPAVAAVTTHAANGGDDRVLATPATRRLARELGVDLATVQGNGPRGRVLKSDVEAAARGGAAAPAAERSTAPSEHSPAREPVARAVEHYAATPGAGEERIPYRGLRRAIGDQMVRSAFTAPHFTLVDEVDFTEVDAVRRAAKDDAEAAGTKLTYLPFVIKALCAAIRKYPSINASLDEEEGELVVKHDVHVGFALDTDRGLMVPVVKSADRRGLLSLASEIARLSELGRAGKASREDLTGSTITITSAGSIGGAFATPIINHPEVAIIGVYQITDKPVVRDGQIVIRKVGFVSITLDHRVVDGATAARVVNEMKRVLGNPGLLLLGD